MIRCVIVEDEDNSRDLMVQMLRRYCPDTEVVGTASSVEDAVLLINLRKPDLVFLDIEIDGGTGFDVLNKVGFKKMGIIFVTAYDQFAIKAFRYSALSYLLKPINFEELIDSVEKFKESRSIEIDERQQAFVSNSSFNNQSELLIIPSVKGFKFYHIKDILWLASEGSYTTFRILSEKVVASKPIGYFEEILPENIFYRIHNRSIININYIREYQKGKGGVVVMSNGEELDVAERRKEGLMRLLNI